MTTRRSPGQSTERQQSAQASSGGSSKSFSCSSPMKVRIVRLDHGKRANPDSCQCGCEVRELIVRGVGSKSAATIYPPILFTVKKDFGKSPLRMPDAKREARNLLLDFCGRRSQRLFRFSSRSQGVFWDTQSLRPAVSGQSAYFKPAL